MIRTSRSEDMGRMVPTPELRVNRRVTKMELEAHQARRTVALDAARERAALEAANAALYPLERSWWTRAARWLRHAFGRA